MPPTKPARAHVSRILPFAAGLVLACLGCTDGSGAEISRHPYLQLATSDSITIVWRTSGGTIPVVRYGTAPDQLSQQILPVETVVRLTPGEQGPPDLPRLHSAPPDTFQYEATAYGLQPGTTYYYGVFDGDVLLAGADDQHHFTTHPTPGEDAGPLRLWVTGDSGSGTQSQVSAFDAMRTTVTAEGRKVDAFLHLGDMAYGVGRDDEFSTKFFQIYSQLLRNTVIWPTMGNHEGITSSGQTGTGPYYDAYAVPTLAEAGGLPSGSEAYYSFDIGHVHFISLDSHDLDRSPAGEMALWLKADLEATNADWLIAFWHHPPYTKGTHNSDTENELIEMREYIMPILESGGVDLVMGGHSHIYERSMLIDGAYSTPTIAEGVILDDGDGHPAGDGAYQKSAALNPNEGTVAMVAGNGYSAGGYYGICPIMRTTIRKIGSVLIDIEGDTLTGRMVDITGAIEDEFQLVKRGAVPAREPIAYPWQPSGPEFVVERFAPGDTRAEIYPVPAAPDSHIFYSLDGALPTLASPRYTGPVSVSPMQQLYAFSIWRDGQRSSLPAASPTIDPHLSLLRYPATASDDAFENALGEVDVTGDTILIGEGATTGIRFTGIDIPRGAHIVGARLQFSKSALPEYTATSGIVYGELTGDSARFTHEAFGLSSRPKTTAQSPWIVRAWTGTNPRDINSISPDLSEVITEIIAQPGWQPGNALSLFLQHTGARHALTFEQGKARAASLGVTYIDPEGLGERLASQPLSVQRRSANQFRISLRWPAPDIAASLGLSLQVEVSDDLFLWTHVPIGQQSNSFPSPDGFADLFLDIFPADFGAQPTRYLRVRVTQAPGP